MKLSRRDFLKAGAAGAMGVGVGAIGLSGCSPTQSDSSKSGSPTSSSSIDLFEGGIETTLTLDEASYDVDVVVVGGGAGGMAACATAAESGLSVLLVEASTAVGGTTQFAEGIAAVHSQILKDANADPDLQELVKGELEFSNYCVDSRLVKEFLEASNENLEWLMGMGVEFYPQVINTTQHLYVGQGKTMIGKVNDYALSQGAQIVTNTKAKRLFMDDKKVTGLLCEDENGNDVIVKADAVILACGGYIQNSDMVDTLQRFNHDRVKITANTGHDGAHMAMAYSAGAERSGITLMHFIWAALENFDLHSQLSTAACNEGYFWVDSHGKRFCDESLVTNPSCIDNIILNQKKAYSILTDAEAKHLATNGCNLGWGSYIFAGTKMTELEGQLAEAKEKSPEGFFYGETIDELAEAIEVDPATLSTTIANYNSMVATGVDSDFGKTAPWLQEVPAGGPFYAFELKCSAFCTMGGIRVNEKNEVLDGDFNGIPGLYCAGVDCSGLQGTTYCMNIGGGAQGYAVYSGRNSVRSAKGYLGK